MSSSHRKPEKPALQAHAKPLILSVHEPMRKNNNFISSAKKFNSTELQGLGIFQVVRKILFWFLARRNTLPAIIKIRDTSRWVWRGDKSVSQSKFFLQEAFKCLAKLLVITVTIPFIGIFQFLKIIHRNQIKG